VNPTRGLDVAATAAVREELRAQARAGTAVLVISTELDEVLELGQRIAVLFRGPLLDVPAGQLSREAIGLRMLGERATA
jgi:simple sugar transport system ATP-binding protein